MAVGANQFGLRRRDRRGRGLRGPLFPPVIPANRTRSERFDDAVLESVQALRPTLGKELDRIDFAVEDVPPSDPAPWENSGVALGRCFPAEPGMNARIVVYRRPIETRATSVGDLAALVHEILVEQLSRLLNRRPGDIDPRLD